ncbi:MAG: glutamine cyclotransferase [Polyangiaceae bacterium]
MKSRPRSKPRRAEVVREIAIDGVERIAGVTHDGERLWFADMTRGGLVAVDPASGKTVRRLIDIPVEAGTAFDGQHLYQLANGKIHVIDRESGAIVRSLEAPPGALSGMAYAAGALWIGDYTGRSIHKVDPATGRIEKTIACDRFVTGVTWAAAELWHGVDEEGSELRHVDAESGEVLERLALPANVRCSGLESDPDGRLWFGDRSSGTLRAVKRK